MTKRCELCGDGAPKYICQECGRAICESCIEPNTWLCIDCYKRVEEQNLSPVDVENRIPTLMNLFFIGFALTFIGAIILILTILLYGTKSSLVLIFSIGPIPIIFGAGEDLIPLLVIATILTVLCVTIFIVFNKRMKKVP